MAAAANWQDTRKSSKTMGSGASVSFGCKDMWMQIRPWSGTVWLDGMVNSSLTDPATIHSNWWMEMLICSVSFSGFLTFSVYIFLLDKWFLKLLKMVIDDFQVYHYFHFLFIDVFFMVIPTFEVVPWSLFRSSTNTQTDRAQWAASVGSAGVRKVVVLSIWIALWIDIRISW